MTSIIIFVFAFIALIAMVFLFPLIQKTDVIAQRLKQIQIPESVPSLARVEVPKSRLQKLAMAVGQSVPLTPKSLSMFKLLLVQAGIRTSQALAIFLAIKVLLAGLFVSGFALYGIFIAPKQEYFLAQLILVGVLGFILPNVWLLRRKKARQEEILASLPDALDLLTVCIEAGLGLDAAIVKITEEKWFSKRALAEEFHMVTQEVRLGKPRSSALRDMADRTTVDDLKGLVASLIQTERLGTSVAQSLRVNSESLRVKRRQRAEEAAAKTTVKLVFPLAIFIFPALMVIVLGPAIIRLMHVSVF
jgi:tight adherence protein C